MLPLALLAQVIVISVLPEGSPGAHRAIHLGTYGLVAVFVLVNLRLPGLWLASLGGLLNAVAIAANDGVMPASEHALRVAGLAHEAGKFANSDYVVHPTLGFLGDVFAIPAGWPLANVFSVGDVILVVGVLVALHRICSSKLLPRVRDDSAWRVPALGDPQPQG